MTAAFVLALAAVAPLASENTPSTTGSDAPTITVRADRGQALVGDVVKITITAIGPRQTAVNLPGTIDLAPFALLNRSDEEKDIGNGKMQRAFTLSVAAYEPGPTQIPAIEVTYLGKGGQILTTKTAVLPVKITSLLANEPEPALKDNAPPVQVFERNMALIYTAAGLMVAALGGAIALMVRKKLKGRVTAHPAAPARPPHEIALQKLDRLGASFREDGDHRIFYFQLSEIIREYLGPRFGFDSIEMTSEELVAALQRRAPRGLVLGEVAGWLAGCDLVKFAKVSPGAAEARGALETAIRIVSSTRPRLEPAITIGAAPAASEVGSG